MFAFEMREMPLTKVSVLRLKENMKEHRTLQTLGEIKKNVDDKLIEI